MSVTKHVYGVCVTVAQIFDGETNPTKISKVGASSVLEPSQIAIGYTISVSTLPEITTPITGASYYTIYIQLQHSSKLLHKHIILCNLTLHTI